MIEAESTQTTQRDATPPVVLSVSASDSGGGAGVQADLKTYFALGVHGASAVTALTAQSTAEFRGLLPTPPSFVVDQVDTVLADLDVRSVKTGMLGSAAIAREIAAMAQSGRLPHLVVDPVLVSSTGASIGDPALPDIYRNALFPHAAVVTPNAIEAELLLGSSIQTITDLGQAARALGEFGPAAVVVKAGRLREHRATDALWDGNQVHFLDADRVVTANDHGSGCTFAAATAAGLAHGRSIVEAVETAKRFVDRALLAAAHWRLGAGHGPLDHRASLTER